MTRPVTTRGLPGVVVGIAALVLGATGCSTLIDGVALKDPAVAADAVNTALLQPGNYPTAPLAPTPPSERAGKIADAHRMADHVVVPWEVDPSLSQPLALAIGPAIVPSWLNSVLRDGAGDIAAAHGFINGFASNRADTEKNERRSELGILLMRFPSEQDATAAASDMHQQLMQKESSASNSVVPGHPEALATRSTFQDGRTAVSSLTARGPYVLFVNSLSPDGPRAESMVAKALDLQVPAMDSFQATDGTQLATIDPDPTGLWARTLQKGKYIPAMGVYGSHGVLHFMQPEARPWLEAAGVDAVSLGSSNKVYQTRDNAGARGLADNIAIDLGTGAKPATSVPGMPNAKCFFASDAGSLVSRYNCVAAADRWVMVVGSQQERDAAQQLSAQYLMLAGK